MNRNEQIAINRVIFKLISTHYNRKYEHVIYVSINEVEDERTLNVVNTTVLVTVASTSCISTGQFTSMGGTSMSILTNS